MKQVKMDYKRKEQWNDSVSQYWLEVAYESKGLQNESKSEAIRKRLWESVEDHYRPLFDEFKPSYTSMLGKAF